MAFELKYLILVLAVLLPVYWGVLRTASHRTVFLGAASLLILFLWVQSGFGTLTAVLLALWLLIQCVTIYHLGRIVRARGSGTTVLLSCLVPLLTLVAGKYLLYDRQATHIPVTVFLTIGISYYALKNIHYLVESGRGRFGDISLADFLSYITFFPMFTAGPIERLDRFTNDAGGLSFNGERFSRGLERIVIGLGKKFILADMVLAGCLAPGVLTIGGAPQMSWGQLTAAAFFRFFFIYVEFSGYTDLVIGTGRLFGFELMENFRFPMLRPNLAEFWRAWHISLSSWVRDYIYFPLLALFRSPALGIVVAMMAMGLWHDAKPGWLLWGAHHGLGLVILSQGQRLVGRWEIAGRIRSSAAWRFAGVLMVWWYVSVGHSLTIHAGKWSDSLGIYMKLMSGGLLG